MNGLLDHIRLLKVKNDPTLQTESHLALTGRVQSKKYGSLMAQNGLHRTLDKINRYMNTWVPQGVIHASVSQPKKERFSNGGMKIWKGRR